jgi:hypothetical protein
MRSTKITIHRSKEPGGGVRTSLRLDGDEMTDAKVAAILREAADRVDLRGIEDATNKALGGSDG